MKVTSVAASSNGVAPGALVGMYKVFGCSGSSTDDVIISAMDKAVLDGCDIINLSLAAGSGYAARSVYNRATNAALERGILVVKAAGNYGMEDGAFRADGSVAAGAVAAGAAGETGWRAASLDDAVVMASFSSYGPTPTLELTPHVAAPGANLRIVQANGAVDFRDGTSYASPYIAGCMALWLQHKQQQAAASGQPLELSNVNQDAAMKAIIAGSGAIEDLLQGNIWRQPIPRMGAGPFTTNFSVTWTGPPNPTRELVVYDAVHEPSTALDISNGWYKTSTWHWISSGGLPTRYFGPRVQIRPRRISINSSDPIPQIVQ
eukprot:gene14226-14370_t